MRRGRVWRWPLMLATVTLFGLFSALLGDGGIWWLLSWTALATPLLTIAVCLWLRRFLPSEAGEVPAQRAEGS
jgi:hypothetical protein